MVQGGGRLASIGLAMALGGCATVPAAENAPPTLAYVARASLPAVRDCLVRGAGGVRDYLNFPVPPPQVVELSDATKVTFLNDARIYVELRPSAAGTDVRYVRRLRAIRPASSFDGVVQACAAP